MKGCPGLINLGTIKLLLFIGVSLVLYSKKNLLAIVFVVCRLLGIDRVVAFALTEWLQDIKKNQLPSLLGGVGPLYSLVQLGQYSISIQCQLCIKPSNFGPD